MKRTTFALDRFLSTMVYGTVLAVALCFASETASAQNFKPVQGSCASLDIPVYQDGTVDWIGTVKVLKENAPVFDGAWSNNVVSRLPMSQTVELQQMKAMRVKAATLAGKEIGWVDRDDLLCQNRPIRGESGLEQKFYIRTKTTLRAEKPSTVIAYTAPDSSSCDTRCRELSRFNGYFIFAVDPKTDRYLLAESYLLDDPSVLVGWVDPEDGFIWDTAFGLRPKENLVYAEAHEKQGEEKAICVYKSLDDAKSGVNCNPVLGGDRWFHYPDRIPVIGREGQHFHVVLPVAATGVSVVGGSQVAISPTALDGSANTTAGVSQLRNLQKLDIFFLIDGTQSMDPYIDAIRGTAGRPGIVQRVIDAFAEDDTFRMTQLRFGYRVYRDTYAGNGGIGEGLPLDSNCEVTPQSLQNNLDRFNFSIANVQASTTDSAHGDNDYEENLFGGIDQAVGDLLSCPENTKVLFVIGDHGYSAGAQSARGERVISASQLVTAMKGSKGTGEKSIVTFFIQTPEIWSQAANPDAYRAAYQRFTAQGRDILSGILSGRGASEIEQYLLVSNDATLTDKILTSIKRFGDVRVVNELIADLRGGSSLVDAITRLQGAKEFRNLPGLFWDIVEQGSCKSLGPLCNQRVFDTVLEGYIQVNEEHAVDVWMTSDDLTRWVNLLDLMRDVRQYSGQKQREAFVQALVVSLEAVIAKPLFRESDETLEEFLSRKGGLPIRDNSPLLSYSLKELLSPQVVPNCEVLRLANWMQQSKRMLAIVSKGDRVPVYATAAYPGACPGGEAIPFIDGDISQKPFRESGMSYSHPFQKARIFWVPREYLP